MKEKGCGYGSKILNSTQMTFRVVQLPLRFGYHKTIK